MSGRFPLKRIILAQFEICKTIILHLIHTIQILYEGHQIEGYEIQRVISGINKKRDFGKVTPSIIGKSA